MKTMNKLKNMSMVVLCACTVLGSGKAHAGNTHTLLSADKIATEIEKARQSMVRSDYGQGRGVTLLSTVHGTGLLQAHIKYKELQIELLDLQYIKRTNPRKGGEVALQIALKKEQLELKALEIKKYLYYVRGFK